MTPKRSAVRRQILRVTAMAMDRVMSTEATGATIIAGPHHPLPRTHCPAIEVKLHCSLPTSVAVRNRRRQASYYWLPGYAYSHYRVGLDVIYGILRVLDPVRKAHSVLDCIFSAGGLSAGRLYLCAAVFAACSDSREASTYVKPGQTLPLTGNSF